MKRSFKATIKQGFRAAMSSVLIAGILFGGGVSLTSCIKDNSSKQASSKNDITTSDVVPVDTDSINPKEELYTLNYNIVNNTKYDNFKYDYAMYTYENESPVVKLNGRTEIGGQETYAEVTYDIDESTYESLEGLSIQIEKQDDGTYKFSNDYNYLKNSDKAMVNEIIEEISKTTPASTNEKTYQENVHDVLSYLRKKDNKVTISGIYFNKRYNSSCYYYGYIYVEDKEQPENGYYVCKYKFIIKQLVDYAEKITAEDGSDEYIFNQDRAYSIQMLNDTKEQITFSESEYLDFINTQKSEPTYENRGFERSAMQLIYRYPVGYDKTSER